MRSILKIGGCLISHKSKKDEVGIEALVIKEPARRPALGRRLLVQLLAVV